MDSSRNDREFKSIGIVLVWPKYTLENNTNYQANLQTLTSLTTHSRGLSRTLRLSKQWETEKTLVASVFFFSHYVFLSFSNKFHHLCQIYFVVCKCQQIRNPFRLKLRNKSPHNASLIQSAGAICSLCEKKNKRKSAVSILDIVVCKTNNSVKKFCFYNFILSTL